MIMKGSIFAAMLTPMRTDGSIAPEAVPALVDYIVGQGVHGVYAGGSTGEAMMQSVEERQDLLTAVTECAASRCTVIAHVGAAATQDAVRLAEHAAKAGCHALSAVPPYYYRHCIDAVADHYHAIVAATDLPLIIYNIPALSGTEFTKESLLELLTHPKISGVKYTAPNLFEFDQLRRAAPDKKFFFGTDEMFLGAAAMGTDGGIGSTYNLIGSHYVGIEAAVAENDIARARELQTRANTLISILIETGVVAGLKHAMRRVGVPLGPCRAPFRIESQPALAKLDAWVDENLRHDHIA